ncbi:MAG: GGDEF domain-containing protein [Pseudomonadota bacterium]
MTETNDEPKALQQVANVADLVENGMRETDWSLLNKIIDSIADPIFVKNADLVWILVNQAFCDFIGIPRHDLIGKTDADLLPADEAAVFNSIDRRVLATGEPNINEELLTSASSKQQHVIRTTKTMFVDDHGSAILVGIFTDLTALRAAQRELETANQRLRQLALSDALTELPNRRAFEETLERAVSFGTRNNQPFAVLFFDLNGFKPINDTYGHDAGDDLLREVAARLRDLKRKEDFVARLGGDEFVMIAENSSPQDAAVIAQRLAHGIGEPVTLACGTVEVGVSIGIACFPDDADQRVELMRKADLAMYHAKRVSDQTIAFFEELPAVS